MKIVLISKEDGRQIDGSMFFINKESDDGTASLKTTLLYIKDEWRIFINDIEI